ncbi:hypothetical protein EV144_106249 [Flavobacterium sp. 270]|uniref:Vgb family protein n=1 Tax=Flavobacterium sp. 270 TaxID=2512114 RepID=UPI001066C62B|nr:hypothetical protein [Flavobacterium sp. 270]TDW46577.1 hypothetical protein EV144_106249 [Flavobacterium sp. 270]
MKENIKIQSDEIQSSTGNYEINKPLKLNTVNEGYSTDNILVHGMDNEVKSVPRSEFGGENSGTPFNISMFNESGNKIINSNISVEINNDDNSTTATIESNEESKSGLRFAKLNNPISISSVYRMNNKNGISQMVVDSEDNIFVIIQDEKTIYKVDSFGKTTEYAYISTANQLYDLCIDSVGNLFVSDRFTTVIHKIDTNQVLTQLISYGISSTTYMAIDSNDNLWILNDDIVRKINKFGTIVHSITLAQGFSTHLTIDKLDNIYVTHYSSNKVTKIEPNYNMIVYDTTGNTCFDLCCDDDNNVYITNILSSNVTKITSSGSASIFATCGSNPQTIKFINGDLYVYYSGGGINPCGVDKISLSGNTSNFLGTEIGISVEDIIGRSKGNIVLAKWTALIEYIKPSKRLLTLDEIGNVIKNDEEISIEIIQGMIDENRSQNIDNFTKNNSTTTSLSGMTLNSTYPNASNGFRVHCLGITGGGLTYEKTDLGWIQYAITIVSP